MSFFVQLGYGKGGKLDSLASEGKLQGVILSPSDESPESTAVSIARCKDLGIPAIFDPQTYIFSARVPGEPKKLSSHGIAFQPIDWSIDSSAIQNIVDRVSRALNEADVDAPLLAPGVIQTDLQDILTPLSVQFARAASIAWGADRTFATVVVQESGLRDWNSINRWLNVATTLEVAGFYLLVDRQNRPYPFPAYEPQVLTNLLRMIHVLKEYNSFEVVWGYSDIEGVLTQALGSSSASGWFYSSRSFSIGKWYPRSGGSQPAARVTIPKLLTPVRATDEAARYFSRPELSEFADGLEPICRAKIVERRWSNLDAQLQHLGYLSDLSQEIASHMSLEDRLDYIAARLRLARQEMRHVEDTGLLVEPVYRTRLEDFSRGLDGFRQAENL